jgi:hypothetical protein
VEGHQSPRGESDHLCKAYPSRISLPATVVQPLQIAFKDDVIELLRLGRIDLAPCKRAGDKNVDVLSNCPDSQEGPIDDYRLVEAVRSAPGKEVAAERVEMAKRLG